MASKVAAKDVIEFFKNGDIDLVSLVVEMGIKEVADRLEKKAAAGQRMAKARAGRGKAKAKVATPAAEVAAPAPTPQAQPRPVAAERHQPTAVSA